MAITQTFSGTDYWALILGGSSGMGLATAQKLAAEGMNVYIVHRDRRAASRELEARMDTMRQHGVEVVNENIDGIKEENIAQAVGRLAATMGDHSRVRLLLHAMSKGSLKLLATQPDRQKLDPDNPFQAVETTSRERLSQPQQELSRTDYLLTLEAMALSLYDWVKAVFSAELFASDARVLGLTSEGNQKAWYNYAAVSAAKTALEAISRSIALEFAPYGIRSNILQPGVTDTPSLRMIPGQDLLKDQAQLRNPFGRLTTPEDVANVVYLMCRDEASWINGAIIPVDGGEKNS